MFISLATRIAAIRLTGSRRKRDGAETDLSPSKNLNFYVCMEAGMSDESGYTPPHSVPRLESLLRSFPSDALAPVARPSASCVDDMGSVRDRRQYPHVAGDDAPEAGPGANRRLDLLTALPPEVAVHILHFLRGKDLCCVMLVSKAWCSLALIVPLRTRRLKYVQRKREKYLQLKENICPSCRHLPLQRTPRSSTNLLTTGSPLQSISTNRPDLIRATSSNHTHAHPSHNGSSRSATRMMPYRVSCPLYRYRTDRPLVPKLNCTPQNADVFGEEIENDDVSSVRRCLFPFASPRYLGLDRAICRHSATEQDAFAGTDSELDMSKKAVRKRLKRL